MNRPKKSRNAKRPQLWTRPLARSAEAESRLIQERELSQLRPFVFAQVIWLPITVLFLVGATFIDVPAGRHPTLSIPELSLNHLGFAAQSLMWIAIGIAGFEMITRWQLIERAVRVPTKTRAPGNRVANTLILVALALGVTLLGLFLNVDLALLMIASAFLGCYLMITGVHRRVGWDRRCANCAYPHPEPKPYPVTCPECGRTLRPDSHKDIILGQNVRSIPRIVIGLLLLGGMAAFITLN